MNINIKVLSTVLFLLYSFATVANAWENRLSKDKGLFIIQFCWDPDSYGSDYQIAINYRKSSKMAMIGSPKQISTGKNATLELELASGTYEIASVEFYSSTLSGKKIHIPTTFTFNVSAGKITNGGLVFLIKDPKSDNVMLLPLDNEKEARRYCAMYKKEYAISGLTSAWKVADDKTIGKLKAFYAELIVAREKAKPRKSVKYLYGVMGTLVKLEKTTEGTLTGFRTIETNTFQEIRSASIADGKMLLDLGQGQYLYGSDHGFSALELPADVESKPHVYLLGPDKFLAFDENINIYSSTGSTISWKKQSDFRVDPVALNPHFNIPHVSFGPDHIYLFTIGPNKFKRLWYSGYDDIHFSNIEVPEEIKRIPDVIATKHKLVIGPIPSSMIKNQASIYVKETGSDTWQSIFAPRGDCDVMYIDAKDDNQYVIHCGITKDRIYRSTDAGKTWSEAK